MSIKRNSESGKQTNFPKPVRHVVGGLLLSTLDLISYFQSGLARQEHPGAAEDHQ